MPAQTLMLLRRFPILNDLPIAAIQSQGLAKVAVQVGFRFRFNPLHRVLNALQTGVAHELIRRNRDIVKDGDTKTQKDLLSRLRQYSFRSCLT